MGVANYHAKELKEAAAILKANGTPLLITQPNHSMLDRWVERDGLLEAATKCG